MSKLQDLINQYCPNGVEYKSLGELGTFLGGLNGKTKEDFKDGNSKFITYMNVFNNMEINLNITDTVKIKENEKQNSIQYGDVLFTGSSETSKECGMSSVLTIETKENLYLNSFCFIYRFNNQNLFLPSFSKHLFRSNDLRKQIIKTASGVTRFNISKTKMAKVKIPVPPLPVQEEIVRILDTFTELTQELTQELTLRKKQYEYYRDKLLDFSNRKDIVFKPLGKIGKICMCKRIMKAETNTIGDVPFYKIGTFGGIPNAFISKETFEKYKKDYPFPKKGDILISASGTIGRTVIYDGKPAYYQDSNIVWIDNNQNEVLNSYLYYFYQTKPWIISTGGTIARLYNDNLAKTIIPVPPLEEQQRIVDILDRFDSLCNDLTSGLPAEIKLRQQQYEYYRDRLLTFKSL